MGYLILLFILYSYVYSLTHRVAFPAYLPASFAGAPAAFVDFVTAIGLFAGVEVVVRPRVGGPVAAPSAGPGALLPQRDGTLAHSAGHAAAEAPSGRCRGCANDR